MLVQMYAIYDKVSREYSPPDLSKSDAVAERKFRAFSKGTPDPADFELWCIGSFDTESALVTPCVPARQVVDQPVESLRDLTEVK